VTSVAINAIRAFEHRLRFIKANIAGLCMELLTRRMGSKARKGAGSLQQIGQKLEG
jgi:hypothetical protein